MLPASKVSDANEVLPCLKKPVCVSTNLHQIKQVNQHHHQKANKRTQYIGDRPPRYPGCATAFSPNILDVPKISWSSRPPLRIPSQYPATLWSPLSFVCVLKQELNCVIASPQNCRRTHVSQQHLLGAKACKCNSC